MTNLLAFISGADTRLLSHAAAGKNAWASVGLNILLASLLVGAAAALCGDMLLPHTRYFPWLWTGLIAMCLGLITLRKFVQLVVPRLHNLLLVVALLMILICIALIISIPFEAKLLMVANPMGSLTNTGSIQDLLLDWLQVKNGMQSLDLLRIAIRLTSFIMFALPFFVGWSAREGTFFQVKQAQKELYNILTKSR